MLEPFFPLPRWIKWRDIERCPYTFRDPEYREWSRKDDERLLLAALDNYADYLKDHNKMTLHSKNCKINDEVLLTAKFYMEYTCQSCGNIVRIEIAKPANEGVLKDAKSSR